MDILTFITDNAPDFIASSLYDLTKFVIGYVVARLFYEQVFKRWRWGRWTLDIRDADKLLAHRDLSPERAERIIKNDDELSIYVKGVVSPHAWLNMDIGSPQARECGLLVLDHKQRKIVVDLAHNPPKQAQARPPAQQDVVGQQPDAAPNAPTASRADASRSGTKPSADLMR